MHFNSVLRWAKQAHARIDPSEQATGHSAMAATLFVVMLAGGALAGHPTALVLPLSLTVATAWFVWMQILEPNPQLPGGENDA